MSKANNHINERQFSAFVKTHQGQIRAFLRRLCKNAALADDLAQETFVRAFRSFGQVQDEGAHRAWLFKIAYRIFIDYVRKESRRKNIDDQRIQTKEDSAEPNHSLKMDLEQAMNTLPNTQRAAIILSLSYGLSHRETARALDIPLGTAKSHINRGKLALRGFLSAYEKA